MNRLESLTSELRRAVRQYRRISQLRNAMTRGARNPFTSAWRKRSRRLERRHLFAFYRIADAREALAAYGTPGFLRVQAIAGTAEQRYLALTCGTVIG